MTLTLSSHKGEHYTFIRQATITDKIELGYFVEHGGWKELLSHFTLSTEEFVKIEKALKEAGK
jgi:guanylate kinase